MICNLLMSFFYEAVSNIKIHTASPVLLSKQDKRSARRSLPLSSLCWQLLHGRCPAGAGPCCPVWRLRPRAEANMSTPKVSPFLRATQHHPAAPALPRLLCTAP